MTNAAGITKALNDFVGNKIVRQIALESWGQLVNDTPVDTGRARGSWRLKENEPDPDSLPPGNYGSPTPPLPGNNPDNAKIYFITNNLPYIVPLNEGHSEQAGAFFIETALARAMRLAIEKLT